MNIMKNKDLFKKVKDLNLPRGKYALFGSAPLGIRKLRECRDIDIIVTENLWNKYNGKSGWKLKKTIQGSECLENDGVELWKDWKPEIWDIEQLIREAEIIEGLPFVRIKYVIEWKKLSARKKDLKDVEIIKNFLRTIKS